MLCYAVICCDMLCYAVLCCAMLCYAVILRLCVVYAVRAAIPAICGVCPPNMEVVVR